MDILFVLTISCITNVVLLVLWLCHMQYGRDMLEKYNTRSRMLQMALEELYISGAVTVTLSEEGEFVYIPSKGAPPR